MEAENICSVSVFFVRVGSQISHPLGEQDQSNALPQGQQRQSSPHGAGVSMFGKELFLPLEGARIYLRFFGLQKDEIMEFGWKSSFNLGDDDCKTGKCFLTHSLLEILPKNAF